VVDIAEKKVKILAEMMFPPLVHYDGGSGEQGREASVFRYIKEEMLWKATFEMSAKKAPGVDRIRASVI
jgi:hypothetical protein